jgi:hypothetical protein
MKKENKFDSQAWLDYITKLRDIEWNYRQLNCKQHFFEKIPKSGKHLGIPLWRCVHCEAVTQTN